MTGTEQTANLAGTVAQTFADLAADMMRVSASAWSPAPASAPHPGRSWYRAPAPNPFDLSAWAPSLSPMAMPWTMPSIRSMWGMPFAPALMPSAMSLFSATPWSAIAAFANTMAMFEPSRNYWAAPAPAPKFAPEQAQAMMWQAVMWPMLQLDAAQVAIAKVQAADTTATDFARHRSSGGHAASAIRVLPEPAMPPASDAVH